MNTIEKKTLIHIYNFIYAFNFKKKLKDYILFESIPDYSDSPKRIFDKMLELNINNNYKLIWIVQDINKFKNININNVLFIERKNKIKFYYYLFNSKYILDSNYCLRKVNKNQIRIFLTHGTSMKGNKSYFSNIGKIDYITVASKWYIPYTIDLYNVKEKEVKVTGLPRNDCFFIKDKKEEKLIKDKFTNNYILWLPTFRDHKNKKNDSEYNYKTNYIYGVPILNNSTIKELNKLLIKENIILYIKLHPNENTTNINKLKLSNIKLINDNDLNNISINQLLKYSKGLITDYSSLYFDYSLLNKPIGLTISDLEEYKKHIDIIFDYKKEIKGIYINNINELKEYILETKNNNKFNYKEYDKYNDYHDSKSAERVIELLNLKNNKKE